MLKNNNFVCKKNAELIAKYSKEANEKMNAIIKTLSEEEWNRQFSGHYRSIHELCSHIFIGDYTWLDRFRSLHTSKNLPENYFDKNIGFHEVLFENIPEYVTRRVELDNMLVNFIAELDENDFEKGLQWTTSQGISFEKKLRVCLTHLSYHQTHHRGMVSLYLDFLGKENDYSNFYQYG
jgi:uncharacterized damage-inducible protein DinB